jgi:hypothetical protein
LLAERLVQEGFFQIVEGGQLLLVEGFEALGFFAESIQFGDSSGSKQVIAESTKSVHVRRRKSRIDRPTPGITIPAEKAF